MWIIYLNLQYNTHCYDVSSLCQIETSKQPQLLIMSRLQIRIAKGNDYGQRFFKIQHFVLQFGHQFVSGQTLTIQVCLIKLVKNYFRTLRLTLF